MNTPDVTRPPFTPAGTFMGIPSAVDASGTYAALLGIPFDCGLHPVRMGARMGPAAIRQQSTLVRPYQPPVWDNNPLADLCAVDLGNVDVVLADILETYRRIESAVGLVLDAGATPVTFGGDGAVTLPQLRAVSRRHPGLALVHFDAHTDTYPDEEPRGEGSNFTEYNPATTFTRAAEEGLLDVAHSLHIGARGPISVSGLFEFTRAQGYELIDGMDLSARGITSTMAHVRERLQGRPVYVCWDMDFFDPSCAPGVFTPTWGGVSAREGLSMLQGLAGLDIVATDVNTLSPLYDVGGMTAFLAAQCVMECLHLVDCARNR